MRIIVISDNHGNWRVVTETLAKHEHDYAVHLGDAGVAEALVAERFNYYVGGNHDYDYRVFESVFELGGVTFLIVHGHLVFNYHNYLERLVALAKKRGASAVLFGHLHLPIYQVVNGITLFCPGSIAEPRSAEGATFLLLDVDNGQILNHAFIKAKQLV